ncbi:MAG TPA: hypothetical protein VH120_17450 [Gemmataceae bacterium]|jgi:hypothetical protein|nr:hypothetical protein [Gemmataceae bacterium]
MPKTIREVVASIQADARAKGIARDADVFLRWWFRRRGIDERELLPDLFPPDPSSNPV